MQQTPYLTDAELLDRMASAIFTAEYGPEARWSYLTREQRRRFLLDARAALVAYRAAHGIGPRRPSGRPRTDRL